MDEVWWIAKLKPLMNVPYQGALEQGKIEPILWTEGLDPRSPRFGSTMLGQKNEVLN